MGSCISTKNNIQSVVPHGSSAIHSKIKNSRDTNTTVPIRSRNKQLGKNAHYDTKYPYNKFPHKIDISKIVYDHCSETIKYKLYNFYRITNILINRKCTHTIQIVYIRHLKTLYSDITSLMFLDNDLPIETQFSVSSQLLDKIRMISVCMNSSK